VIALGIHPGFVRTAMTERLATSVDAQRWMPDFNAHAHDNWTDGSAVVELVDRIARGAADSLAGRILHVDDDLDALVHRAASDDDLARLRWAR
jgi:NAD(P)-dependent dehydrogenase (short-subunit alcohol dehydrogenase family)